jgi:hypothetical protein
MPRSGAAGACRRRAAEEGPKMRSLLVVSLLLASLSNTAAAQVSVVIGLPVVRIQFSQPEFPRLVAVPGYPVYYDPGAPSNYFFYDGLYWVYEGDTWYASSWYDGPWGMVSPQAVPLFILRVPVRYYRQPPAYFQAWQADAPPRWGDHWGRDWQRQRGGWDKWDRREAPPPAPLPAYQRQYAGNRYPRAEQQEALRAQNYRHEPRDAAVSRVHQEQAKHAGRPAAHAEPVVQPVARPPAHAQPGRPQAGVQQPEPRQQHQPKAREPDEKSHGKKAPSDSKDDDGKQHGDEHGGERGQRR